MKSVKVVRLVSAASRFQAGSMIGKSITCRQFQFQGFYNYTNGKFKVNVDGGGKKETTLECGPKRKNNEYNV